MKLCKDCKWRIKRWFISFCDRPNLEDSDRNPINGKTTIVCSFDRDVSYSYDTCGPDAKYWEAK
jgi:hypothetical protein